MIPTFKNDAALIVGNVVVVLGLFALCYVRAIDWPQVLGAIALLQFPSLFGRKDKPQ